MKKAGTKGMSGGGTKNRGRTSITGPSRLDGGPRKTDPKVPQEVRREASRPQSPGAGKHRGDRRDTSPTYTGNERHPARGNNPRIDVKTRKR